MLVPRLDLGEDHVGLRFGEHVHAAIGEAARKGGRGGTVLLGHLGGEHEQIPWPRETDVEQA